MVKLTAVVVIVLALLAAGCGGDTGDGPSQTATGTPRTSAPTPRGTPPIINATAPPVTPVPEDAAVYLSIGDSIQYGCCGPEIPELSAHPMFTAYLAERLNRPVEWVTVAGNDTAEEMVNGFGGVGEAQLDRVIDLLEQYEREGRDVVTITLSIGGNDLLLLKPICEGRGGSDSDCVGALTRTMDRLRMLYQTILSRINEAKDPDTPLLQLNVYDFEDCGQPNALLTGTSVALQVLNTTIYGFARSNGAFVVDINTPFRGHACEYIRNVDPTYEGYAVIAEEYRAVHESLPAGYVDAWVR